MAGKLPERPVKRDLEELQSYSLDTVQVESGASEDARSHGFGSARPCCGCSSNSTSFTRTNTSTSSWLQTWWFFEPDVKSPLDILRSPEEAGVWPHTDGPHSATAIPTDVDTASTGKVKSRGRPATGTPIPTDEDTASTDEEIDYSWLDDFLNGR